MNAPIDPIKLNQLRYNRLGQFRQKLARCQRRSFSEQGLTLMECLVAILMISAVLVAITPPIFLAVASRVQNRRAAQAIQLAAGEVDRVRVLVEQGVTKDSKEDLPALGDGTNALDVPAPSSLGGLMSANEACNPVEAPSQVSEARPVDTNGDCEPDFLVQTFRVAEQVDDEGLPIIFRMGVRVYSMSADSFDGLETKQAALQLTTGEGQQTKYPLAAMYTVLGKGDLSSSMEEYRCFTNTGNGADCE
jgi:type II secretory pathway pseudopilin PulG